MDAVFVSATPQTPSSRLKKSLAWVCFNSFGDEKKAQCRSCGGVVTWTDAKCTTRTMWWHLYSKHRNQHDKLKIMADKLKMTYDGARQKVNFDHPLDNHTDLVPSTSDSGEKENEATAIAQFIQEQIDELFASEMGKNADIPSLLTPRPPRRRPGAQLAHAVAETPMSPMHSNLDIMSEGSRASSPNTVVRSHSSPSPSPSDATHEGGFSQHSSIAPRTPMSVNGYAAIDFSTPLSPGAANGDQQYIKRPLNAYMMWTREERKKILAEDPKKKMHDISREMGERWKSMTDQQKKPYFEKAKAQKAEHKRMLKEHPNWVYQPNKMKGKKKTSPNANDKNAQNTPAPTATPASTNGRTVPAATPNGAAVRVNGNALQRPAPPHPGQQPSVAAALLSTPQQTTARLATPATAGGPMRVVPGGMQNGTPNVVYHPYPPSQTPRYAQGPNGQTFVVQQNGPQTVRVGQNTYVAQALAAKPQGSYQPQQPQLPKPASVNQVLDMYYTSLCQPAFPEPGEPAGLGMRPSHEYYDQYQAMQHHQYLQQQYHQQHHYQQQHQFTSSNGLTYQSI